MLVEGDGVVCLKREASRVIIGLLVTLRWLLRHFCK